MTTAVSLAVGAVITRGDTLLLIQRATEPGAGRWSLPGGRVEAGERMRDALARELVEEVAMPATIGDVIGIVERVGPDHHFVIVDYAADVAPDARAEAGDDAGAVAWVPIAELEERDLVDGLGEFLAEHSIT